MGRPCARALDCWAEHFDVEAFFRKILTHEEFVHRFCRPPRSKLDTLFEVIEKAKKVAADNARKNVPEKQP